MTEILDITPWALERAERFLLHSEAVGGDYTSMCPHLTSTGIRKMWATGAAYGEHRVER